MRSNSDLEDEIDYMSIRTWRMKLRSNSGLEDDLIPNSDMEDGIEIPEDGIEIAQVEIGNP